MKKIVLLLMCGIFASVIYVGSDIWAAFRWEGYSYQSYSVSELRAIEAPTRSYLVPVLIVYSLLEISFGVGVLKSAVNRRFIRIAGILLIILGIFDSVALFFPMHTRDHIQQSGRSIADELHIGVTFATVMVILSIIGFGSRASEKAFRFYSYGTIILMLLCGAWASMDAPLLEVNLPTPWLGIKERINIYGYMVWIISFSYVLLKSMWSTKSNSAS